MNSCNVKCKYDFGPFWNAHVVSMICKIEKACLFFEKDVSIEKIERNGDKLIVEWDCFDNKFFNDVFVSCIYGIINLTKEEVETLCVKCGKNKGKSCSENVFSGFCLSCSKSFSKSDFENTVIISVSGKAGSGKDTIADFLVQKYGFIKIAFADPLKDIIRILLVMDKDLVFDRDLREKPLYDLPNLKNEKISWYLKNSEIKTLPNINEKEKEILVNKYGWKKEELEDLKNEEYYWSVRKLLQFSGTEMFRDMINRDIWTMNLAKRISPNNKYVISDCRFENEYKFIKEFGCKSVFIEVKRKGCNGNIGLKNHESEKYSLPSDFVIYNNSSLSNLYKEVQEIIELIK